MTYQNGAPAHYAAGVEDGSTEKLFPVSKSVKQTQPLLFLSTLKGPYVETDVVGGEFEATYGNESINPLSKFFNHQSLFALKAIGLGCQATVMRAAYVPIDSDNNPTNGIANITIFSVKTKDTIDEHPILRDASGNGAWVDGDWKVDEDGDAKGTTFFAMTAKFMSDADLVDLGVQTVEDGITKGDTTVDAVVTPIMTIRSVAHGEYYNNIGIKLYPLIKDEADMDMMNDARNMAYFISLIDKSTGKEKIIKTIDASDGYKVSFDTNSSHPVTNQTVVLEDIFPKKFENTTNPKVEFSSPIIGEVTYYRDAIEELSKVTLVAEANEFDGTIQPYSDFKNFEKDPAIEEANNYPYFLNLIDGRYTSGAPMEMTRRSDNLTFSDDLSAKCGKKINLTKDTTLYLEGGLDGMNFKNHYDSYVVEHEKDLTSRIANYSDPDAPQTHLALSTVSEFVDTGYSMATKFELGKFNAYRTDVRLIIGTYEVNKFNKDIDINEHISRGILLKSMLALSIESEEFNTANFRTVVVIGSGLEKAGLYRYRLPTSYDFGLKNVKMFKGDTWNMSYEFSCDEGNIIDSLIDVTPRYMPRGLKTKAWEAGIIWIDAADKLNVRYPQLQNIYPDDTSVLNSWYSSVAVCYIEKMLDESHRERQGDAISTPTQQVDKMNEKISLKLKDKFGNVIIPVVDVFKTPRDMTAGYAVTAKVKMFAPNMFTVLSSSILALRKN